ncbi:GNAT family N-acetyltransferase [Qipengyuania proteolytica]|uniref:GNAT family N-acetyltransferase n=1 Tax=Qipengyuania proteolytica TaxID=2867239 RepID=UPI001FFCC5B5|nr:GNAT family N-acetyltransferase [Qipengyuania proteolytica]
MPDAIVRPAVPGDAPAVQAIYAFHVAHSTATFDTEAPDAAFWAEKIAHVAARGWPFLVIEVDGAVRGYAYATQFRDRAAYAHTCEDSIYIADVARGQGLGTQLLAALVDAARASGFEQMIGVIGGGEPASVALHARLGFVHAGRMRDVGMKFGRRLDTVYMQLSLLR